MYLMRGTMLWVCCQTAKSGAILRKMTNAPLEVAEHYFYHSELAYIKAAKNKDKAFFTLWTLKRKLYENDRQRNEPSFGFF